MDVAKPELTVWDDTASRPCRMPRIAPPVKNGILHRAARGGGWRAVPTRRTTMRIAIRRPHLDRPPGRSAATWLLLGAAIPVRLALAGDATAVEPAAAAVVPGQFCTNIAKALHTSCPLDAQGTYWQTVAACRNIPGPARAEACLRDAQRELDDAGSLCDE